MAASGDGVSVVFTSGAQKVVKQEGRTVVRTHDELVVFYVWLSDQGVRCLEHSG